MQNKQDMPPFMLFALFVECYYYMHGSKSILIYLYLLNILRPMENVRQFAHDIWKCILLNDHCCIFTLNTQKIVSNDVFFDMPSLVSIMAWRRIGDKPLSGPMML